MQVDPNLPERFELEYTDRDGQKKRPIMIHRALFGSIERFFAILLEHYAGAFPVWLSPVQVVGIPVAEEYADYLGEVIAQLKAEGVRAELDHSDDRMQKKIRTHTTQKVPLQLIAGEQDRAGGHGVVPLPRRHAAERRPDRRRRAPHPRGDRHARAREHRGGLRVTRRCAGSATDDAELDRRGARSPACPDEFQRLWTPHRMAYIQAGPEPLRDDVPVLRGARACPTRTRSSSPAGAPPTCC